MAITKYEISRLSGFTYNEPFNAGHLSPSISDGLRKYMKTQLHYTDATIDSFWPEFVKTYDFGKILVKEDQKSLTYTIYFDSLSCAVNPTTSYALRLLFKLTRTETSSPFDISVFGYTEPVFNNVFIAADNPVYFLQYGY